MKTAKKLGAVMGALIVVILLTSAIPTHAMMNKEVEYEWNTYRNNVHHTSLSSLTLKGNKVDILWKFKAQDGVVSSISIGKDGTLYFGSWDKNFYAVSPDGTLKWKIYLEDSIVSSPAIGSDGTIYVGAYKYLYKLNTDGKIIWKAQIGDEVLSSPVIGKDGTIYIGADSYKIGSSNGWLCAVGANGSVKWKFKMIGNPEWSSPAIDDDGTVYIGTDYGIIYAINPDGSEKWKFQAGDDIFASPTIGDDGTIYVPCDDSVYALNKDGSEKWKFSPEDSALMDSDISIDKNGNLYGIYETEPDKEGNTTYYLFALNPNGDLLWRFAGGGEGYSSSISYDGTIVFGDSNGIIHAVKNGSELWNFTAEKYIIATPTIGANNTVYVGDSSGYVYALHVGYANSTSNIPEEEENIPWLWIVVGLGAAAIVIAAAIFLKKRKDKKKENIEE